MLGSLEGRGWVAAQPPLRTDGESVVARFDGEPVKAGFLMDVLTETESTFHAKYRSGKYDLEVKVDYNASMGYVRVNEADGYDV